MQSLCDEGSFAIFKIFSTTYQICLVQKAENLWPGKRKQKTGIMEE